MHPSSKETTSLATPISPTAFTFIHLAEASKATIQSDLQMRSSASSVSSLKDSQLEGSGNGPHASLSRTYQVSVLKWWQVVGGKILEKSVPAKKKLLPSSFVLFLCSSIDQDVFNSGVQVLKWSLIECLPQVVDMFLVFIPMDLRPEFDVIDLIEWKHFCDTIDKVLPGLDLI